jgi:hypothetical protein
MSDTDCTHDVMAKRYDQKDGVPVGKMRAATPRATPKVGDWTFPHNKPRGTKAARIDRFEGEIVHLSDGSSMHRSHVQLVREGSVAL